MCAWFMRKEMQTSGWGFLDVTEWPDPWGPAQEVRVWFGLLISSLPFRALQRLVPAYPSGLAPARPVLSQQHCCALPHPLEFAAIYAMPPSDPAPITRPARSLLGLCTTPDTSWHPLMVCC